MLRITNNRDVFYQWDIGQSLTVELATGETLTEVHIGIEGQKPLYIVEPINNIVAVYDELLQSGQRVVAYEYVKSGNDGHTVRKYVFNVAKRPKADNYEYTPTTSYSWEYWCERARLYAVAAEGSKNSAAASVSSIPATMTAWWNAHRSEFKGDAGADGQDGANGTSASAVVEQTSTGAVIYCTDADGTTTATITNGQDGADGNDYVITEADKHEIANEVEGKYTTELTRVSESLNHKVGFGDYASSDKSGVVKTSGYYLLSKDADNRLIAMVDSYNGYISDNRNAFISKGTLENVLANKTVMVTGNQTLTDTEKANARKRIGLGEFELIEEITCDGNTRFYERNTDTQGTPYNFRKVLFVIERTSVGSGSSDSIVFCNNTVDWNGSISSILMPSAISLHFVEFDGENGIITEHSSQYNSFSATKVSIANLKRVPMTKVGFFGGGGNLPNTLKISIYAIRG